MKRALIIVLLGVSALSGVVFPQTLTEPTLVRTWRGGEDWDEFIDNTNHMLKAYLNAHPNGRIIARLCSKDKFSLALISSSGFAFNYPWFVEYMKIPAGNVFFARYSKCAAKTEQYWFVPQNTQIDYEELIPVKNVTTERFIEEYSENPASPAARREFVGSIVKFIEALKNDPKADGFIVHNIKTRNKYVKAALAELKKAKIDRSRYLIIRKKQYSTYYPEFMTVTIKQ